MLGQLGHVMVGLADSIMIGQLGTIPLAASAFGNSLFVIPLVFGLGMAYGMTPPIANADGEGKPHKAGSYLKHGFIVNMATALALFLMTLVIYQFSGLLGQEENVEQQALPYFLIISTSIFPLMLFLTFKQFAEGLSDTRFAMLASVGANLINVGLNYLLIFGHWGFPNLGIEGAAYATLIARCIMAAMMLFYILRKTKFKKYIADLAQQSWEKLHFIKLIKLGGSSGLQYIFETSAFAAAAILIGQINAESLAAHQIAISLAALSYMAASGIGAAVTVRVGNQLGKGDIKTLRKAAQTCFVMGLGFMALCGLVFFIGRYYWPTFYTEDPLVMEIATSLLVIAVIFQLADGLQVVVLGALRGMGEVRFPTLITLFSYWFIGIGSGYLFGFTLKKGPEGVWYGLALGLIAAAVLLYWRFQWKTKRLLHEKL